MRKVTSGGTENSSALKRWMIAGSGFAGLIVEFENLYLPELDPELNYIHHKEELSTQKSLDKQVTSWYKLLKIMVAHSWIHFLSSNFKYKRLR